MTREEFGAIEINENGFKLIPAFTDLSDIKEFGDNCSFGLCCSFSARCSLGERCSFGEGCSYVNKVFKKYYQFGGLGPINSTTRVYLLIDNSVRIEYDRQVELTIEEFKNIVESEYEPDKDHGILYRHIIKIIESIISINRGQ